MEAPGESLDKLPDLAREGKPADTYEKEVTPLTEELLCDALSKIAVDAEDALRELNMVKGLTTRSAFSTSHKTGKFDAYRLTLEALRQLSLLKYIHTQAVKERDADYSQANLEEDYRRFFQRYAIFDVNDQAQLVFNKHAAPAFAQIARLAEDSYLIANNPLVRNKPELKSPLHPDTPRLAYHQARGKILHEEILPTLQQFSLLEKVGARVTQLLSS